MTAFVDSVAISFWYCGCWS